MKHSLPIVAFAALTLTLAPLFTSCPTGSTEGTTEPPPSEEATLTGIAVSTQPSKTDYAVNDEFSAAGLIITASYSTGAPKHIAYPNENLSLSQPDMTTKGTKRVTVIYTEGGVSKDTYFDITVDSEEEPTEETGDFTIAIKSEPYKTEYEADEALSLSGLTLTVTYKDGTTQDVNYGWNAESITASEEPYTPEEAGDTLTLAYEDGMVWSGEAAAVAGKAVTITYDPPTEEGAPQVDVLGLAAYRLAIEKAQGSGGTREACVTITYTEDGKPATARYTITRTTEQNGTVTIDGTGWEGKEDVVYSLNFSGDNISKMKSFVDPTKKYASSSEGALETDDIIPGVSLDTKIYRYRYGELKYAQAFNFNNAKVNINLNGNAYDLSSYEGGVRNASSVTWDDLDSQAFTGNIETNQLDKALALISGKGNPTVNIGISDVYDASLSTISYAGFIELVNLYGTSLVDFMNSYYGGNEDKFKVSRESYSDLGLISSGSVVSGTASSIKANTFSNLPLSVIANTVVEGDVLGEHGVELHNVKFTGDVSKLTLNGLVYGLIDFAVAPKSMSSGRFFKVILRSIPSKSTFNGDYNAIDLSKLSTNDMSNLYVDGGSYETYFKNKAQDTGNYYVGTSFYHGRKFYEEENESVQGLRNEDLGKNLTNEQWERVGNGETDLLSRANPINQTLMQRLLGSNQPYYS